MGSPTPGDPAPPAKLLGSVSRKVRLAAASAVLLAAGTLLAPTAGPRGLSVPTERPAPLLEAEVQRREPPPAFAGFQDVTTRVSAYSVAMPPPAASAPPATVRDFALATDRSASPRGFGVVVSAAGDVLTHATALADQFAVHVQTADGMSTQAQVVAYESASGLALLRLSPAVPVPAAPIASEQPAPGALAIAVARWDGRDVAAPVFVASVGRGAAAIRAVGPPLPPGTPIYTAEGTLFAIAATADQAYPVRDALQRLTARTAAGRGHEPSLGLAVQRLAGALAEVYGGSGVLVSDLVPGAPAAVAGLEPGDVLRQIDDVAIDSPEALQRAVAALERGTPTALTVSRGGRERPVSATVASAFEVAARARAPRLPAGDSTRPEAGAVFPRAQLDASTVPSTARILRVNGRTVTTRAEALREARRRAPVVVYLLVDGERYFVALEPQP